MDKMMDMAEQHILESAARLRHIDELMARARIAHPKGAAVGETAVLLAQIEADRDRLAQEVDSLKLRPGDGDIAKRSEGLKGLLQSIGLQLEQVLGSVLEKGK